MKVTRIFSFLLLTLILAAPRMASAQKVDTLFISVDCQLDPAWDFGFLNWHNQFVNAIRFISETDSVTFDAGSGTLSGTAADKSHSWATVQGTTFDSLIFYNQNAGGILTGQNDSGWFFLLDGPGGSIFPPSFYDHPVTILWQSGIYDQQNGTFMVIGSGYLNLTPTIFQDLCTFDSVSGSAATPACDPIFDFHVFNHNGLQRAINQMKFELPGITLGNMRPSEMVAPAGWEVDSVTEYAAYFGTKQGGIPPGGNLDGFHVGVRANASATSFPFVWTAINCDQNGCGIIDRDTVPNIPASPQPCTEDPSFDTVSFSHNSDCSFIITMKNFHTGNGNLTVSPLTEYTFHITTPGVTWDAITLPPQSTLGTGTWQYSGLGTDTLTISEVSQYRNNAQYAQAGGTIWTLKASFGDPSPGEPVSIAWSDSSFSVPVSSGTIATQCMIGLSDTAWIESGSGSDCNYALVVENRHTAPTSSIDAIGMVIPAGAGSFPSPSCFTSSLGWPPSVLAQGASFINQSGPSKELATGSYDTLHFCIDPVAVNTPWQLTVSTYDPQFQGIDTLLVAAPGCVPPLVCDSVHHSMDTTTCTDTIIVLNQREAGAEVDSIVVTPMGGATVGTNSISAPWHSKINAGNASVSFYGSSIPSASPKGFTVSYRQGTSNTFPVTVSTYSMGANACANTQTVKCESLGGVVSPPSVPQSLDVTVVPNPMNGEATITLSTSAFDRVQMVLLDVLGRNDRTVVDGTLSTGDHAFTLDVSQLPPGTYYLRVQAAGQIITKKLVVEH